MVSFKINSHARTDHHCGTGGLASFNLRKQR
jgi:hypothetical protein